ncbi:MAG: hypothetical protein ACRCUT_10135 [Spirochaetota bacterium]
MPFVRVEGISELVFVPEEQSCAQKKHPCSDCHSCQWCSDERCAMCRIKKAADQQCRIPDTGGK